MKIENPLLKALRAGAVVVSYSNGYVLADSDHGRIVSSVSQFLPGRDVNNLKNNPDLMEGTAHLDNEWAGADDGRLRRVIFHTSNQGIADNVYRTSQVISNLNADIAQVNAALGSVPGVFTDLPLLAVFKYLPNDDGPSELALKVGRSTAVTGIKLNPDGSLVNTSQYEFKGEKIRLRKNALVVQV